MKEGETRTRREVLAAGAVLAAGVAGGIRGDAMAADEVPEAEMLTRLQALAALPDDTPVVMLNLLKFKPEGGEASYNEYGMKMAPFFVKYGIEVLYMGECQQLLIGEKEWDRIILVQYPTRKAFIEMVSSAEYQEVSKSRTDGIVDSVLYATLQTSLRM